METVWMVVEFLIDWINENSLIIGPAITFWLIYRARRDFRNPIEQTEYTLNNLDLSDSGKDDFNKRILERVIRLAAEVVEYLRIITAATLAILVFLMLDSIS